MEWLWLGIASIALAFFSFVGLFIHTKRKKTEVRKKKDSFVFEELQGITAAFDSLGIPVQPMSRSHEVITKSDSTKNLRTHIQNDSFYPISLLNSKSYGSTPQLPTFVAPTIKINQQVSPRIHHLKSETYSSSPSLVSHSLESQNVQELIFSIIWTSTDSNLVVNIIEITNLPPKIKESRLSIVVSLRTFGTVNGSSGFLNAKDEKLGQSPISAGKRKRKFGGFSELFRFPDASLDTLQKSELIFEISIRRHLRSRVQREIIFPLAKLNLEPDFPTEARLLIDNLMTQDEMQQEIGQIKIGLQFLQTSNSLLRIKIIEAKLNSKLTEDYRVEVIVKLGKQPIKEFGTLNQSSVSLIWDTTFCLNFKENESADYLIEVCLMKASLTSQAISILNIGCNSSTAGGIDHWNSMISSPNQEISRWYPMYSK